MNSLSNFEIPKCINPGCNKFATLFGELGFNKKPMFLKTCAKHYITGNIVVNRQLELSL
jgi:hypothetical protein